jgi:hypothetical protein
LLSGRTLYLLSDGLAAQHAYAVLARVMTQRHKWGLGRVYFGTISVHRYPNCQRKVNRGQAALWSPGSFLRHYGGPGAAGPGARG